MRYLQCEPEAHNQDPEIQRLVWQGLSEAQRKCVKKQFLGLAKKRTGFNGARFAELLDTEGTALAPYRFTQ